MALTSSTDSSSPTGNTPARIPYRLDTTAVLIIGRPIQTAQLIAIRAAIQPRRGWWQFELKPWHYWTAITSATVIAASFVALLATHGAIR